MLLITPRRKKWLTRVDWMGRALGLYHPRPLPLPAQIKKILILELWGIGDVVLSTTVLQGLRDYYPQAKLVLLAQTFSREVLKHCPWPDELIEFRFPWTAPTHKYHFWRYPWRALFRLFWGLKKQQFDLALDARMDIRNNVVMWLSGARHRAGFPDGGGGFLLTHTLTRDPQHEHRVEEWQQVLSGLGASGERYEPRLCVGAEERNAAQQRLATFRENHFLIGLHPGAAHPIRRWPTEKFIATALALQAKVNVRWLIFGEDTLAAADTIQQAIPGALRYRGNLQEFLAGAEQCDLILSNDSGPMHMCAALGKPVVAIFGPQKPEWFGPWGRQHKMVVHSPMDCRPCYDQCEHASPRCMDSIESSDVVSLLMETIAMIPRIANPKPK